MNHQIRSRYSDTLIFCCLRPVSNLKVKWWLGLACLVLLLSPSIMLVMILHKMTACVARENWHLYTHTISLLGRRSLASSRVKIAWLAQRASAQEYTQCTQSVLTLLLEHSDFINNPPLKQSMVCWVVDTEWPMWLHVVCSSSTSWLYLCPLHWTGNGER